MWGRLKAYRVFGRNSGMCAVAPGGLRMFVIVVVSRRLKIIAASKPCVGRGAWLAEKAVRGKCS